ncbi:MAG: sugar transferase, partial [Chitinophagaceae bacterium]
MNRRLQFFKFLLADFLAAVFAWMAFYILRKYILAEMQEGISFFLIGSAVMIGIFWVLLYTLLGQYRDIFRKSRLKEVTVLAQLSMLGAVIIFFALLLDDQGITNYDSYYKTVGTYFLLHFSFATLLRIIIVSNTQNLIEKGQISFNTIIVGSNLNARELYLELNKNNRHLGLNIVGFVHVFQQAKSGLMEDIRNLGLYNQLPDLVKQLKVEEIVIAIEPSEHRKIEEILGVLEGIK